MVQVCLRESIASSTYSVHTVYYYTELCLQTFSVRVSCIWWQWIPVHGDAITLLTPRHSAPNPNVRPKGRRTVRQALPLHDAYTCTVTLTHCCSPALTAQSLHLLLAAGCHNTRPTTATSCNHHLVTCWQWCQRLHEIHVIRPGDYIRTMRSGPSV